MSEGSSAVGAWSSMYWIVPPAAPPAWSLTGLTVNAKVPARGAALAVAHVEGERIRDRLAAVVRIGDVAAADVGLRERVAHAERGAVEEQRAVRRGGRDRVGDVAVGLLGVVEVELGAQDGGSRALVERRAGIGALGRIGVLDLERADIDACR